MYYRKRKSKILILMTIVYLFNNKQKYSYATDEISRAKVQRYW